MKKSIIEIKYNSDFNEYTLTNSSGDTYVTGKDEEFENFLEGCSPISEKESTVNIDKDVIKQLEFKGTNEDWELSAEGICKNKHDVDTISIDFEHTSSCIELYADSREVDSKKRQEELLANAKLIVHSLKTLKALQLMVNNFKEYQKESGAKNQAILKAEQAINKALN